MKTRLLMNILLTLVWVALTGTFTFVNFLFGFGLTFLILYIISLGSSNRKYFRMAPKLISFVFFFIWELIKANIQVAVDVVTPKFYMKPGIIGIPLSVNSDAEITLLANLITLTPGTLSLDVSDDKSTLYVHAMYISDEKEFIQSIKQGFERRIIDIFR